MRIAIDGYILHKKHRNQGSHVYALNLLRELRRLARPGEIDFEVLAPPVSQTDAFNVEPAPGFRVKAIPALRLSRLWRLGAVAASARSQTADVLYCPVPVNCGAVRTPTVVTVHDSMIAKFPFQKLKSRLFEGAITWGSMNFAERILTDSQHAKADLVESYGVREDKIAVTYLGCDHSVFNPTASNEGRYDQLRHRYGIRSPYVMHHSTMSPRKNIPRLIQACRLTQARHPDLAFDLVLAGPLPAGSEDILDAARNDLTQGRIIFTGAVPEQDLAALIRGATLCVIPSLYEGFCLPLLECMACGAPTIASRSSCIPEISAGKLKYFDPSSVDDIACAVQEALTDSDLRKRLRVAGSRQASQFTWGRCARETFEVLRLASDANGRRGTMAARGLPV